MSLNVDLLKGDRSWETQAQLHNFERNQHYQRRLASVERERRRMENSTYVPTSLQSPALMVLASTAEASRDTAAAAMHIASAGPPHHFAPGGAMDGKEIHVPFTASSFTALSPALYAQPHDSFHNISAAHLLHMHAPFLTPNMDRALGFINPTGGGAFRPVSSAAAVAAAAAERNGFHSAFMPASKCPKMDQNGGVLLHRGLSHAHVQLQRLSAPNNGHSKVGATIGPTFGGSTGGNLSPVHIKDEGSDHDTSSSDYVERFTETPLSDVTDGTERSTPDEARMKNRAKKRSLFDGQSPCCPVCGVTLRCGEFDLHFAQEVDRLAKISRMIRKSPKDSQQKSSGTLPGSANKKSKDSPNQAADKNVTPEARWESYQRVRTNRQSRLSARSKVKKRRHADETVCPICGERVSGTPEELNAHAEHCLRKREIHGDEDEPVDVEGESYEEYEWAGQTRIRATTLLQGGFSASGFQTANSQNQPDEDDIDLNVDGDDSATYGHAQYGEADVIPCSCDEPGEDQERQALRGAVLTGASTSQQHIKMENDNWPERYSESPHDSENNDNLISSSGESYQNPRSAESASGLEKIVESLKARLREIEEKQSPSTAQDCSRTKCRICMEAFTVPLVSVSCWHVHCEECWLRTLGAKKLCPQCNMITSPSDLRRLYL